MIPTIVKIYSTRAAAGILAALLIVAATGIVNDFSLLRFWIMVFLAAIAINFELLNCRQLALASLAGALIFNPYIYPHLPRHIWVIIDIIALIGVMYAAHWATSPYKKGIRFEKYVSVLFSEPEFVMQDNARDNSKTFGRHVESDGHPDFVFRNTKTGKVFAVECKFRSRWAYQINGGTGIWWNLRQSYRYEEFQKKAGIPVYVAFGIGGTPSRPGDVYFLELERLRFPFLFRSLIVSGKSPVAFVGENT